MSAFKIGDMVIVNSNIKNSIVNHTLYEGKRLIITNIKERCINNRIHCVWEDTKKPVKIWFLESELDLINNGLEQYSKSKYLAFDKMVKKCYN